MVARQSLARPPSLTRARTRSARHGRRRRRRHTIVMSAFLSFLSAAFGWIYFFAWSLSFYPQVILNWSRKSYESLAMAQTVHPIETHTDTHSS